MKKLFRIDLDIVATSASILCAIHCALVPLVLTFGMMGGATFFVHEVWDAIFMTTAIVLAFVSLGNGYRTHHQRWYPIITASIGFAAFIIGHMFISGLYGDVLSVAGGLTIATAHVLNYRACRDCKKCRA